MKKVLTIIFLLLTITFYGCGGKEGTEGLIYELK